MGDLSRKKIGIMGGTFDPIHIGHLILAECAYEQFELDTVLFMPSGNPPHKQHREDGASDQERMDMVDLAIRNNSHFTLDRGEMYRSGFTYTKDTLRILRKYHPDTDYYFIIGADSMMSFDSWKDPDIICRNCILLVAVRDNFADSVMEQKMEELREKYDADIHLLYSPNLDVSSSQLRKWHQEGRSVRYFLPEPVLQYIEKHNIYH